MRTLARIIPVLIAAACGAAPGRPDPSAGPTRHGIQVFSEPSAVAAVLPIGGSVFIANSQGLDRWEVRTSKRTRLGAAEGLQGAGSRALTADATGHIWMATDVGVGDLDLASGKVKMMPPPPAPLAEALTGLRFLAPDPAGGAWVGAETGLFHVAPGGWNPTAFRQPVTALHLTRTGTLWIGTREGIVERNRAGIFSPVREGSTLRVVLAITEGPDGATVALGEDSTGSTRLAVFGEGAFTTYKLTDDARLHTAAHRDGALLLAGSGKIVALHMPDAPPLGGRGDKIGLLHVAGGRTRVPYSATVLDYPAPPDITALAAAGDIIYVGTRTLGTSALQLGQTSGGVTHLRPRELVAGARGLTVACRDKNECYLATGGTTAWRYDGRAFSGLVIGPGPVIVLAVVRNQQGEVLALYREPSEHRIHVARLAGTTLTPVGTLVIETPSGAALTSFARIGTEGLLWLGLQYVDADGDVRPYGVATVDLALGAVTYHHEGADRKKTRVLPVPNDVVDISFQGDSVWFASGSGAALLRGESVRVWTEADALKSEILRGIVATEGGMVYVASSAGVGQFDGTRWSYPDSLAMETSSLGRDQNGRLWVGTDNGLVMYDGKRTEKVDRAAGLLDDRVFNLAVDDLGRVWVRGTEGISLVTP